MARCLVYDIIWMDILDNDLCMDMYEELWRMIAYRKEEDSRT